MFKSIIKGLLPSGRRVRRPLTGLFRGLHLHLDFASETLIFLGVYERETHAAIAALAGRSGSCIDIGAGKGELVCWWLRHRPARPIVAVEPNPSELAVLRQNVSANASSSPAHLTVWPGFAGEGPRETHRSLEELSCNLPQPVFVKIDIEGAEQPLLEAARDAIESGQFRFLIETHGAEVDAACRSVLEACGYAVKIIEPAWWRRIVPERRLLPHNRWLLAEPAGRSTNDVNA